MVDGRIAKGSDDEIFITRLRKFVRVQYKNITYSMYAVLNPFSWTFSRTLFGRRILYLHAHIINIRFNRIQFLPWSSYDAIHIIIVIVIIVIIVIIIIYIYICILYIMHNNNMYTIGWWPYNGHVVMQMHDCFEPGEYRRRVLYVFHDHDDLERRRVSRIFADLHVHVQCDHLQPVHVPGLEV